MDKSDDHIGHWLTDADLFEIADSLLFEIRLEERLDYLFTTYAKTNGIRVLDAIIFRLDQIKYELDKPLREELKGWNGYIIQEKAEGRIPDLDGLPTLAELRKEQGYPTNTLFPQHWHKMSHISWQYVEDVKVIVSVFKLEKEPILAGRNNRKDQKGNSKNVDLKSKDKRDLDGSLVKGFDIYVIEDYRDKLMPYLIKQYSGKKPKQFGYMLYALNTLGLIAEATMTSQTQLHEDLTVTFGEVGTRQRLQQLINELSRASSNEEIAIKRHINAIKAYLKGQKLE